MITKQNLSNVTLHAKNSSEENPHPSFVFSWFIVPLYLIALLVNFYQSYSCFSPDPFAYAEHGKLLLQGKSLYREIYSDKPMLTSVLYAIPQLFVPAKYWIFKMFLGGFQVASVALLLHVVRPPKLTSVLVASFLLFVPLTEWDWQWCSTEHISNLFVLGVLLICWRASSTNSLKSRTAFSVGMLLGMAFLVRQTTAVSGFIPIVMLVTMSVSLKNRLTSLFWVFSGGAATLVLSVGVVSLIGDVRRFIYTTFSHPFTYAKATENVLLSDYWKLIEPSYVWLLLLVAIVLSSISRQRVLLLSALIIGVITILASPRGYGHYAEGLFPFLAFAISVSMKDKLNLPQFFRVNRPLSLSLFSGLLLIFLIPSWAFKIRKIIIEGMVVQNVLEMENVAAWVDNSYPQQKTMWLLALWNYEHILYASEKELSHPFQSPWAMERKDPLVLYGPEEKIIREYVESPPELILVHEHFWDWVLLPDTDAESQRLLNMGFNAVVSKNLFRTVVKSHRYVLGKETYVPQKHRSNGGYLVLLLDEPR